VRTIECSPRTTTSCEFPARLVCLSMCKNLRPGLAAKNSNARVLGVGSTVASSNRRGTRGRQRLQSADYF
jgi:hypothetical protein